MEFLKAQVHIITNKLQIILSHLELAQFDKALGAAREAVKEARLLSKMLAGYIAVPAKDAVIVAPPGVQVLRPDEVKVKVPGNEEAQPLPDNVVAIVPKKNIEKTD